MMGDHETFHPHPCVAAVLPTSLRPHTRNQPVGGSGAGTGEFHLECGICLRHRACDSGIDRDRSDDGQDLRWPCLRHPSLCLGHDPEVGCGGGGGSGCGFSGNPVTGTGPDRFGGGVLGLCVDSSGRLWATDHTNHRVLRFDNASSKTSGADADGVLGQTNFNTNAAAVSATAMDSPLSVAVDPSGTLWVADTGNNRVLGFKNAAFLPGERQPASSSARRDSV